MRTISFEEQYEKARARMEARFTAGLREEKRLLDTVAQMVIKDRLVPPSLMHFHPTPSSVGLIYGDGSSLHTIHRHALNQLCTKVGFPITYASSLSTTDWRRSLLCENLNTLFHKNEWKDETRFLHRIVGVELRGFLSRRHNRHLASAHLLRSFTEACRIEGAKPLEAIISPVRVSLKCLLPTVYEAFPGEYVCLGVEWSNSDFGAGKHKVCQIVWRVSSSSSAVLDETVSRVHLGSVIEDSDLEISDDTAQKEVAAQRGVVTDSVKLLLSERTVTRVLDALRQARDAEISWSSLKAHLKGFLGKADIEWMQNVLDGKGPAIIELPPISYAPDGTTTPNLYWASSAISAIAAKTEDTDRVSDLQREAGKLLARAIEP